jgi:hypothetical protein
MEHDRLEIRNLSFYLLIAFAFSWLFWIPQALVSTGLLSAPSILVDFLSSPFNPAAFGPLVSAFSVTYLNEGKKWSKEFAEKRSKLQNWKEVVHSDFLPFPYHNRWCSFVSNA